MAPLLSVKGLTLRRDDGKGSAILNDINLDVEEGEVLILKGPSGSGKTTLLRCMAELDVFQKGEILLHGKSADDYGIPAYRTLVQYVPQRPSLLPSTPLDFLSTVRSYRSRQKQPASKSGDAANGGSQAGPNSLGTSSSSLDPLALAEEWGIEKPMWNRAWSTLSGGEGQRIALAIAVGVGGAEVVLLDAQRIVGRALEHMSKLEKLTLVLRSERMGFLASECLTEYTQLTPEPTSALDEVTMQKVEKSLLSLLPSSRHHSRSGENHKVERKGTGPKAYVWITHEGAQAERCGTRTVDLSSL